MRQTVYSVLMALPLAVAACGGFDNTPFLTGTVRGRLTESDPALAVVSRVGNPELRASVATDGSFVLENVPAGTGELFIVASADKAARLPVVVPGGGSTRVDDVVPRAGAFLKLKVKASSRQKVNNGKASVRGTPFQDLQLDTEGALLLGPLPAGCYSLDVSAPGFQGKPTDVCVTESENEDVEVKVDPSEQDDSATQDCSVTGCETGSTCLPDGRCVECATNAQCATGLSCRNYRCEGPGALCAACEGDWQCRAGARCESLPDDSTSCVARCDNKGGCAQGFSCQSGRCLPLPAKFVGCPAYREVGTSCDSDSACRQRGLTQGLCVEGSCTFSCTSDADCPESFACTSAGMVTVCRPK